MRGFRTKGFTDLAFSWFICVNAHSMHVYTLVHSCVHSRFEALTAILTNKGMHQAETQQCNHSFAAVVICSNYLSVLLWNSLIDVVGVLIYIGSLTGEG